MTRCSFYHVRVYQNTVTQRGDGGTDMSFEKPILQVALDFVNLHRALSVAEEAVAGGVDWIEVGTPLIKSEGLDAVRELKKKFPDKTIVADMKIMDVGSVEVQIAAEAGAEVVMMLGVTDDSTIQEGVEAEQDNLDRQEGQGLHRSLRRRFGGEHRGRRFQGPPHEDRYGEDSERAGIRKLHGRHRLIQFLVWR